MNFIIKIVIIGVHRVITTRTVNYQSVVALWCLFYGMTTSEVLTMKETSTKIIHNWVHWLSEGDCSIIFNQFLIFLNYF